jgi:hypothetical protein
MRTLLAIFVLWASVAFGQTEVVYRVPGTPDAGFVAGEFEYTAIREPLPNLSVSHTDIEQHIEADRSLQHKYKHDAILWSHEEVHKINESMSLKAGPGIWAFYLLDNRGFAFRDTKVNKLLVEQCTPESLRRGPSWQQYMTGMNPDAPFIIFDEWVAYIACAQVANELYGKDQTEIVMGTTQDQSGQTTTTSQLIIDRKAALEFAGYATVVLQCIEKYEPNYPDLEALRQFVAINLDRTTAVQSQPLTVAYQRYFQQFGACQDGSCATQPAPQFVPQQVKQATPPRQAIPPKPTVKSCTCDTTQLEASIKDLQAQLADIKSHPERYVGPAGPRGPQGIGLPGPAGKNGRDGLSPTVDAVATTVVEQIKQLPIEFQQINNGQVVGTPVRAYLGGKVGFDFYQQ